ncbi:c-type cytochrome [Myxacorys almedinensis A]|uniref:Cytochrome c6 n=2 Tax=Myxacorys TaxID=2056239 RepID=A0A8J7Z5U3_9CYAN|nr:c-type cytochrome [Myxacorys almedinensis A]
MRTLVTTAILLITFISLFTARPALAADSAVGAKIFSANCAACHMKGGNAVNPAKTLKKEALAQYSKDTLDAIVAQVTNGKAAMPAFKSKLNADQIESVAMYVLEKAEQGW